ncbi:MAG: SDR family NAD(P)-dependent oxidoreductase [Candidatus Altiarchaeota archaeon]
MSRVLVTGGAGFIGSHLCERLVKDGHDVTCIDNFDDYYSKKIKRDNIRPIVGEFKLIKADIRDLERLKRVVSQEEPDYVVHEAAQAGVRASVDNPVKTNEVNVTGTLNLLEATRDSDVKKTVFASSSSVYGRVEYLPFDEEHPKTPISPYGVSKLACENYFRVYEELYGMKYVALRYFTVYGPRIRPDLAISKFTRLALAGGELEVYGNGSKSRDFTHVSDAVEATTLALTRGSGAYNIGGGTTITVKELAERIIELTGKGRIKYVEDQKGDVEHTSSDTTKARGELDWTPKVKFDDGLKGTVEWVEGIYKNQ